MVYDVADYYNVDAAPKRYARRFQSSLPTAGQTNAGLRRSDAIWW